MTENADDAFSRTPVDSEILDRIAAHLARSARFDDVQARPTYAPNAVVTDYGVDTFQAVSRLSPPVKIMTPTRRDRLSGKHPLSLPV